MADAVTCCSCSLSTCVQLLCFLLLLLHLVVGVISLATGHIHHGSSFFQNVFCPNISNNDTLPSSGMDLNSTQIMAPYLPDTNLSDRPTLYQDVSTNKTFTEIKSSCSAMELNMTQMIVPYMQTINIILFISNAALLVCGVTRGVATIVQLSFFLTLIFELHM